MATNKRNFYLKSKDFEAGWKSVKLLNLEISEMFGDAAERQLVQARMLELFNEHMPNIDTKENVFWNLCLQSNRCLLKTDKNISIGWTVETETVENETTVSGYTFYICLFGKKKEYQAKLLLNGGWKEDTVNE